MPITKELKNVRNFESAGFSHEQAETLADVIEESLSDSNESLKDFFRTELSSQINSLKIDISALDNKLSQQISGLDNKFTKQISDLKVDMAVSQKDLLVKIFTIIVGTVGVGVTIIKVF